RQRGKRGGVEERIRAAVDAKLAVREDEGARAGRAVDDEERLDAAALELCSEEPSCGVVTGRTDRGALRTERRCPRSRVRRRAARPNSGDAVVPAAGDDDVDHQVADRDEPRPRTQARAPAP